MRLLTVIFSLVLASATSAAAADWLNSDVAYSGTRTLRIGDQEIKGRIHYDHGNERFEWTLAGGRHISLRLADSGLLYMIDPDRGVGMQMESPHGIPGPELYASLRPEELGRESLQGEDVTKYRLVDDAKRQSNTVLVWVTDDGIALRLLVDGPRGSFESTLSDLERGPQPDELFDLPSGLQIVPAPKP
jgi:hypothetical protein